MEQPSAECPPLCILQLSFICAQMPMLFFLNNYIYQLNHTLYGVKRCGEHMGRHCGVLAQTWPALSPQCTPLQVP